MSAELMQNVVKKSENVNSGGRTKKYGKRNGKGIMVRGWKDQQPGYHDRKVMMERCGKSCFLGPNKSFPICSRNTCKINRKGVYAAYMRAEEYKTLRNQDKYRRISAKARRMLGKKKFLHII
jgi:hypothetical protein